MNPYSPDQKYPKYLVEKALKKCKQEQENTEFLIHVKKTLMQTIQRGREALSSDFFGEPLILEDGEIIIPSPRAILEHEERYHVNSIEE